MSTSSKKKTQTVENGIKITSYNNMSMRNMPESKGFHKKQSGMKTAVLKKMVSKNKLGFKKPGQYSNARKVVGLKKKGGKK